MENTEEILAECSRCGAKLGVIADGGIRLIIENVSIWSEFRYSCNCGRAYKFCPIDDFEPKNLSDVNRRFIASTDLQSRFDKLKDEHILLKQKYGLLKQLQPNRN